MRLLSDNDLCLVSGGKNQNECKSRLGTAVKEFFWDACGILAETAKWFSTLVFFVNSWSYAAKGEGIMDDCLKDLIGKTNKPPKSSK